MKYIIYWLFYSSTLGGGDIAGVIEVTDTTVRSYIYGIGYFTWNIVEKEQYVDEDTGVIRSAEYILTAEDGLMSVMVISHKHIEHHIQTDTPVHIQMVRKR